MDTMGAKSRNGSSRRMRAVYDLEGLVVLLDEVPLVDRDDQAHALVHDVAAHVRVLGGEALHGIDDQDRHVRPADRAQRTDGREPLRIRPGGDLAPAAHARGIDEPYGHALPLDRGVDGVAGGAGDVAHDRALLAQQRVEER